MRFVRLIAVLLLISGISSWADENIRQIQIELKEAGLYQGTADGVIGSQTSAAIRRYQLQHQLKVTGELNPQTLESFGLVPKGGKIPSAPSEAQMQLAELFSGGPYSTEAFSRQQTLLKQAQRKLIERGFFSDSPDGNPGAAFSSALKSWQKDVSLKPTARLDTATCEKLRIKEMK